MVTQVQAFVLVTFAAVFSVSLSFVPAYFANDSP